jgi:hypothetical protein
MFIITVLGVSLIPADTTWFGSPILDSSIILGFIGSIIGYIIINEFKKNRQIQRSEAAIRAYSIIQLGRDYIKKIGAAPGLFEVENYYPFKVPEIGNEKNDRHPERPSRLIMNCIYEFRKDLYKQTAIIGGSESKKILSYLDNMEKAVSSLSNSIYAQSGKMTSEIARETQPNIEKCLTQINEICEEMLNVLQLLIEGKGLFCPMTGIKKLILLTLNLQ